jgi:hypothetical protein
MNAPTKKRIEIQERDLNILEAILGMRYVTVDHIATLFASTPSAPVINPRGTFRGGAEAIAKRLGKLAQFGYLSRIGFPIRRPIEPTVYTLGDESVKALAEQRGYDPALVDDQIRLVRKHLASRSDSKHFNIEHRLGINTFRVALAVALRGHPAADWLYHENNSPYWVEPTNSNGLAVRVTVATEDIPAVAKGYLKPTARTHTITRAPDAFFILNLSGHRVGFLYEKDRGTEAHGVIAAKLACYYHWYKQQLHRQVFGTKHLRVLIETESAPRIENMIAWGAFKVKDTGVGIFWFTTADHITLDNPGRILDPIWTIGHRQYLHETHSLIEFTPQKG